MVEPSLDPAPSFHAHTNQAINQTVGLLALNFCCHAFPLTFFVFDERSCVPLWLLIFTCTQALSLTIIVLGGIECNAMVNEGIDGLLRQWQLRYRMIGWAGGFTMLKDKRVVAFCARDPPGETQQEIRASVKDEIDVREALANVEAAQQSRIESIIKILAHYEADNITPFSVLGVTLTKEALTLVLGFFGGAIATVIGDIIDQGDQLRPMYMCHGRTGNGIFG